MKVGGEGGGVTEARELKGVGRELIREIFVGRIFPGFAALVSRRSREHASNHEDLSSNPFLSPRALTSSRSDFRPAALFLSLPLPSFPLPRSSPRHDSVTSPGAKILIKRDTAWRSATRRGGTAREKRLSG